jgi:predicted AAA+ superfamily ATPase
MDNFGLEEGLIISEGQEEERKIDGKKIRVVSLCKWLLE